MDFVCFIESVGVCEEENMAHRVDNAACFLSPCQKVGSCFDPFSFHVIFVYEKYRPSESYVVLYVTYCFIIFFIPR